MIMQQPTSGPVPVSKVQPFIGLDQSFNVAVNHIANKLNPRGWTVLPGEEYDERTGGCYQTLDDFRGAVHHEGRMIVNADYSDPELTIWGCRKTNYAFRAWHDWHRLKRNAPFDLDGEIAVANSQARDLINLYGVATSGPWRKLLEAEVIGQARYMAYHGQFPTDQKGFTIHRLAGGSISCVFH